MGINTAKEIKKSFGSNPLIRQLAFVKAINEKIEINQDIEEKMKNKTRLKL